MRSLPGFTLPWLGKGLGLALLVDMQFSTGTVYATTAPSDIAWSGNTYLGARQIAVDEIKDQGGELQRLSFTLSGVPSELLSLAMSEFVQGAPVRVHCALLDPDTLAIAVALPFWSGTVDQMPIRHGSDTSSISVTAEHRGIAFARSKPSRYTDAEQRRLFSGDRALEYQTLQSQHRDIWPSREYFKQ